MTLGTVIRQARQKAGLLQAQLAEKVGVGQSVVSQWEGDVISPTYPNRVKLSEILEIPFPDLIGDLEALRLNMPGEESLQLARLIDLLPPEYRTAIRIQVEALVDRLPKR